MVKVDKCLTLQSCNFIQMNFLAHAYLSFNHPQLIAGNMISDFVKGARQFSFSAPIRQGIILHRDIDAFTDTHAATKKAKEFFRPHYRLYSGAIVDVLYDHFLANDVSVFTRASLKGFSQYIYQVLEEQAAHMPPRFVQMLTYMKAEDWLYNYRTTEGMEKGLKGLIKRAAYLSESNTAYNLFIANYDALQDCYRKFFPDVKEFANQRCKQLLA